MQIISGTSLRRPLTYAAVIGGLIVTFVLYRYDPAVHSFYPRCIFHQLTGYNCPGCGSARACYQLLHGHMLTAAGYNLMAVLLLPLVAAGFIMKTGRRNMPAWWHYIMRPVPILAAIVLFWILRNTDLPMFVWLNADR